MRLVPHVRRSMTLRLGCWRRTLTNPLGGIICKWRFMRVHRSVIASEVTAWIKRDSFTDQFARQRWSSAVLVVARFITDGVRPDRALFNTRCDEFDLRQAQRDYAAYLIDVAGLRWR